ncbi:MAG: class I mannose-6-phosphate isomerase [Oscillospiraceae bacterium]|jgi:mannose-6-phosphate isomerase|nr:class I mannose-6-phosphate isomerase [Oscillospiraceae bacterium]
MLKEYIWGTENWVYSDEETMVKLIDAQDSLSIQVHEGGEHWHVIKAEPDAELICGLNRDLTPEEFRSHIENGTLLEVVNRIKVKKGDYIYVPGRTLHAIGKGILIAEIRPVDNFTYRVYDYGRTDKDGNPRELHIEKAMEITDLRQLTDS